MNAFHHIVIGIEHIFKIIVKPGVGPRTNRYTQFFDQIHVFLNPIGVGRNGTFGIDDFLHHFQVFNAAACDPVNIRLADMVLTAAHAGAYFSRAYFN